MRRLVYSTAAKSTCAKCGWAVSDCRCSASLDEPLPDKIVARLRLEKAGRGGKTVTVIFGMPANAPFLKQLAGELKRACGAGGTVLDDGVEIQGDRRETLRSLLTARGWTVKG
jgi:translation initiation factor 1